MANIFHGNLDAHVAIPAPQCMSGGTMNFNFGSDRPSNNGPRSHSQIEPFSTVPFPPDPDFVDRPEILGWLREKCVGAGTRAALVGLGGVGKSQLAIKFACDIHDASPQTFVFWVHASSRTQFEEAYREIAERLQLPERSDPKANVLRLVRNWLQDQRNGNWIMVLDNVDHADIFSRSRKRRRDEAEADAQTSLAAYLPPSRNGSILVISRNRDAAADLVGYNRVKEVLAMDEGEGLQLLRNKLCQPPLKENAVKLLAALDHIPLAITQAAAYINRRVRMSITEYLNDFHRNSKKREWLLNWNPRDLRRDESASNSILTTWQMSFEQIRQERPSAAMLLSLMSFFNSRGIPEWLLREFRKSCAKVAGLGDSDDEEEDDADSKFNEDIDVLWAYSFISATTENKTYEMHPLVQFCMRAWLSSFGGTDRWYHIYVVLMALKVDVLKNGNRAKCQQYLLHIEPLLDNAPAREAMRPWSTVLRKSTVYFVLVGYDISARRIAEKMLSGTEKILGFNDNITRDTASLLMRVLTSQKRLQEAEKLAQRVLQGCEKELGKRNLAIMKIMGNLAVVMRRQGKDDESKKLVQEIVEAHKDERDPHRIERLATVLQGMSQLEEAEKVLRQAIEGCKEELGERHPCMLHFTSSLARVLGMQDQWLEAEKFLRKTLEARKEQLGERHVDTLSNICDLGQALQEQGQLAEAEKLFWQATEGFKELGEHRCYAIGAMCNLSTILLRQNRLGEAMKLYYELWERSKDIDEHSIWTAKSARGLACLLQSLGRYKEATELCQQAYTGYMVQYGPQHPQTMQCYEELTALQNKIKQTDSDEGTVST